MKHKLTMRAVALALLGIAGVASISAAAAAVAADKVVNAGQYVSGDFHNHTTCSDGSLSLK